MNGREKIMKKTMIIGISSLALALMAGCTQKTIETPKTESSSSSSVTTQSSGIKTTDSKEKLNDAKIASVDEVIAMYQKEYPDTDITSIELENENNSFIYKVEGVDDQNEYKVKIDGKKKEVTKSKQEKLDRDEKDGKKREAEKLNLEGVISIDKATEIAEKEAGTGQAVEWDLDRELNVTYWEVKVKDGHKKVQVKLDSKTGDVLQTEQDD